MAGKGQVGSAQQGTGISSLQIVAQGRYELFTSPQIQLSTGKYLVSHAPHIQKLAGSHGNTNRWQGQQLSWAVRDCSRHLRQSIS